MIFLTISLSWSEAIKSRLSGLFPRQLWQALPSKERLRQFGQKNPELTGIFLKQSRQSGFSSTGAEDVSFWQARQRLGKRSSRAKFLNKRKFIFDTITL